MSNYLSVLEPEERDALYERISDEWSAVYKLWGFVCAHGGRDTADLRDYCSDLSSILRDINANDNLAPAPDTVTPQELGAMPAECACHRVLNYRTGNFKLLTIGECTIHYKEV